MNASKISQLSTTSLEKFVDKPSSQIFNPASAFFFAWRKGVELAGIRFFGNGTQPGFNDANCRWDLRPNLCVVNKSFEVLTEKERVFLAALVSFFNADEGSSLLRQAGVTALSNLDVLDADQRDVIAGLIMHNHAW